MQKAKYKSILFFTVFLLLIQFYAAVNINDASAGKLWEDQVGRTEIGTAFGQSGGEPTDIREIVARVIKVFLSLIGVIFLVLIIYAGFRWMTAGGNESQVSEAKSQLGNATIGLIIIVMSYAITSFVAACVFDISTGSTMWMCGR